ncbi:MAG: efflux RND transporter periplasmic adaptor subunit [Bacteroidota bacterium]
MDRKIEKKKWPIQYLLLIAGGIAIAGFIWSNGGKNAGASRLNVKTERLLLDTVERAPFQVFIPINGAIQPIKTVFLDAVEGGRLEEILIEDGSVVQKGQPILRLSNDELQRSYINQEASLIAQINQIRNLSIVMEQQSLNLREQALNNSYRLTQVKRTMDRNDDLIKDDVISQVDWEQSKDEFDYLVQRKEMLRLTLEKDSLSNVVQQEQMTATVDLMRRNLEYAQKSIDNLTVKAPVSGQLSSLDTEIGQLINRGERIAQIDDLSNYKVRARIDEFYISRIFRGLEGSFTFDKKDYKLRIQKIYPEVLNGSFEVDMVFMSEPPSNIKRGQTISIKLALGNESEALLLARGGFYQSTGGNWVYVVDGSGETAFKREIRIGNHNPNYYEILEGLQPGDVVITSGYDNFGDKDELVLK